MIPTFQDLAPFRRWLRFRPDDPALEPEDIVAANDRSMEAAMAADDALGATGEWVALLGFSQGAKMCASLLYRQQQRAVEPGQDYAGSGYRFAVILAGRAPLVSLDTEILGSPALAEASEITTAPFQSVAGPETRLRIPTLHVHGMRDPGLSQHRQLLELWCEKGTTSLVEWDGDHRVPIKTKDVVRVVEGIIGLAKRTGVLRI